MSKGRLAWLGLYLLLALGGRYMAGAHLDGYGSYEDEPAHMVTASMMRGYATAPDPLNPLAYVKDYYLHFPKVGVGQWPPVLHFFLGGLMVPLGVSRWALLIGSCLIAALAALATRTLARSYLNEPLASLLGMLLLALPLVQNLSATAMTELLLAAEGTFAVYCYARYMKEGQRYHALCFGFWTVLAVLTKGSGVGLVMVPILTPLIAGKPRRMFSVGTVVSGIVVGVVGLTWYTSTLEYSQATWAGSGRSAGEYSMAAADYYSRELVMILGSVVSALAVIGLIAGHADPHARDQNAACLAWLIGLTACYLFVRTGIEMRHLAVLLPISLVLAGRGSIWIWRMLGWRPARQAIPAGTLIVLGFTLQAFAPISPNHRGFREAVQWAVQDPELEKAPWLVCSDASGEGLMVSEAVHLDPRHERLQVLRSSKILGQDDWLGNSYRERFDTPEQLGEFLRQVPVSLVFLDLSLWRRHYFSHHESIRRYLESHPEHFQEVQRIDMLRNGVFYPNSLVIYRQIGFEDLPRHPVTLEDVLHSGSPVDR
ncbi:MAG: glycosyltransferase family 39 protein [Planctomycetota bacterium]|nr:glycosyltransferase family 39 protein [Planctomycetota bacterium]